MLKMSVLLKCIKYQKQFSENVILNKNKRTSNLLTLHKNTSLRVVTRNVLSPLKEINGNGVQHNKHCKINENMLAERFIKKITIENILNSIATKDDIHTSEALILLKSCNKIFDCLPAERHKFGEYVWSHLSVCNVPLGIDHYNERLQIYLKNNYDFSPTDILQSMKENGIHPNITTYEWCIEYYCRKGQINCIKLVLDSMSYQSILKYSSINRSLMWGYYQNGNMQAALEIFEQMDRFEKNNETLTILMCIYAGENEIEKVENIIKFCFFQEIALRNTDILRVIHMLVIKGHMEHINKMILYLNKFSQFSSDDIHILLQLIYSNQIDTVLRIVSSINDRPMAQICLQNLVLYSKDTCNIVKMCHSLANSGLCKDAFLQALYFSYFRNDELCLSIMKICSCINKIKPHFFWPILVKRANMYDIKGILDILKIMVNDFNVTPCVTTISSYVLPYMTNNIGLSRASLLECGISSVTIDNAVVLMWLEELKTTNAANYVRRYPGPYLYDEIGPEVLKAFLTVQNIKSLLIICRTLVEKDYEQQITYVSMDKQLLDMFADYPESKTTIKMIIIHLEKLGVQLSSNTIQTISRALEIHKT
ncbi:bicoid stability factor [Augochlora pura]